MSKLEPRWDRSEGSRPASGAQAGAGGSGWGRIWGPCLAPPGGGHPPPRRPRASRSRRSPRNAAAGGGDFQSCDLHKPPRAANGRAPLPESFAWGRAAANGGGGAVGAASSRAG